MPFFCSICSIEFFSPEAFQNHMIDRHTRLAFFSSGFNAEYEVEALIAKLVDDTGKNKFLANLKCNLLVCCICSRNFNCSSDLIDHLNKHKNQALQTGEHFRCNECNLSFNKESYLNRHNLNMHCCDTDSCEAIEELCPHCKQVFTIKKKLSSHIKKHKLEGKEVCRCHICGDEFPWENYYSDDKENSKYLNSFDKHLTLIHNNKDFYDEVVCDSCRKECTGYSSYLHFNRRDRKNDFFLERVRANFANRFKYEVCKKVFNTPDLLENHFANDRCKYFPPSLDSNFVEGFRCDICKKVFSTYGQLKNHLAVTKCSKYKLQPQAYPLDESSHTWSPEQSLPSSPRFGKNPGHQEDFNNNPFFNKLYDTHSSNLEPPLSPRFGGDEK